LALLALLPNARRRITIRRFTTAPMILSLNRQKSCASQYQGVVMAKGQMRVPKEKKKPKADKDKPKQMSAYKASQSSSSAGKK
jgi:hypothetical protein